MPPTNPSYLLASSSGVCTPFLSPPQISDSIVRKGRETLERAIHLVNTTPEWGAKVVYGDTDRQVGGEEEERETLMYL